MADPRAGAGNIRDEPIASCSPRKFEGALKILKNSIYVNGTQEPTENAPKGQCWYDLNSKINNTVLDYTPNCKIDIHVAIPI